MRRCALSFLIATLCAGCATLQSGEGSLMQRYSGSRQLEQAEEALAKGDSAGAARLLAPLTSGPALPGVSDEALFRLALLALRPGAERPGSYQAHQLLRRLSKEYPRSQWTRLAAPVTELLNVAEELKRQNKGLKGNNQALSKEVNELNRSIDRLKHLDVELEKKSR